MIRWSESVKGERADQCLYGANSTLPAIADVCYLQQKEESGSDRWMEKTV